MYRVLVKGFPTSNLKKVIEMGRPWKIQKIQHLLENYEKPTIRKSRASHEFASRRKSMFLHYCIRVINYAKSRNLPVDFKSFNRDYAAKIQTIDMQKESNKKIEINGYSREQLELMYRKLNS